MSVERALKRDNKKINQIECIKFYIAQKPNNCIEMKVSDKFVQ